MRYYASSTDGIGGKLRSRPEDFVVEEIPLPFTESRDGPYLICRLTKTNWELQRAVKEIAKRLGISHRRIAWAGNKDKNAVTTQMISIYGLASEAIEKVNLEEITLEVVGRSQHPIALGGLAGNRFDIFIRDCTADYLQERVWEVTEVVSAGMPNYYGLQRFGVVRPVTHIVGKNILKGDYEAAVLTYIGRAYPLETDEAQTARRHFFETHDARVALAELPVQMSYERAMANQLIKGPGDYGDALRALPPKLLSLMVSAFQSHLFNRALSRRVDEGIPLAEPIVGDRLLFHDGREDIVTTRNMRAALMQVRRGRCQVAIFIPGSGEVAAHGRMDEIMQELMQEEGISAQDFKRASQFVEMKYEGTLRPIAIFADVRPEVMGDNVRLEFTLPPGHYATTVCREYMKAEPYVMI